MQVIAIFLKYAIRGRIKQSFYSQLFFIVKGFKFWETDPIPFKWGVLQGDTLSPIIFLLVFLALF